MSNNYMLSKDKQFSFCMKSCSTAELDANEFPFKRVLSLSPLIDFWNRLAASDRHINAACARQIQEALKEAPELLEPIEDFSIIEKHRALVDMMMTGAFPPAAWEQDLSAAVPPFGDQTFYATPALEPLIAPYGGKIDKTKLSNVDKQTMAYVMILYAYAAILKMHYDIDLNFDVPIIHSMADSETGLDFHFQADVDRQFCELRKVGTPPPLTDESKRRLLDNLTDLSVLMELIPPEHFEFHGFVIIHIVDVTDQEVLSAMKRDLIEKGSIVSQTRFLSLQNHLRTLFQRPDLVLGLVALQGEEVFLLNTGLEIKKNCIYADSTHYQFSEFAGSIYARSIEQGEPLVIEDLTTYPDRTQVEEAMIEHGMRNIVVAPLYYQDELIGGLEIASPNPGDLNALNVIKLWEVLPLFSMAIKRSLDDLDNNIQKIIKEKCTAIHPSVEWRFRQAAQKLIEKQVHGVHAEMESIVFEGVYPLFGVSDIRGSSTHRNAAIQADLVDHLTLAKEIILLARGYKQLPVLDEMAFRVGSSLAQVQDGLMAGDEMAILDFLRREVEPFFGHMAQFGPDMIKKIEAYRAALDPDLGTLYRMRKDFEDSVARINETISSYLDVEQQKAQEMFPHYFEKHTTDGVDYSVYIGASLVEDGNFDRLYLRNLRLWQLMVMCGVARRSEQLKSELPVPLDTAHLIAVQDTPLSIRFRFDERQFDVDGTYNIRYEIIKKRIDKAVVKKSGERLTQPGKIAIVYSQAKEALEYREYIDYLQASGYLTDVLEDIELEDLQGIQGLKALRVTVNLQDGPSNLNTTPKAVEDALQSTDR